MRQQLAPMLGAKSSHSVALKDPEWAAPIARDLPKVACLVMPHGLCLSFFAATSFARQTSH